MYTETDLLLSRTEDLIQSVDKRTIVFTQFLSENELPLVNSLIAKSGYHYRIFGGYDNAERSMIGISSFDMLSPDSFPITTLSFRTGSRNAIRHRDVLGAIMSLGIKREFVGDIIFADNRCFFFVSDTIAAYIICNLKSVANCTVVLEEYIGEIHYEKNFEDILCNVTSMRLDCIVSAVTACSRSDAENIIMSGAVRINGVETKKKDAALKLGSVLTVKHNGKYRIDSAVGQTKKGRIKLKILKYI